MDAGALTTSPLVDWLAGFGHRNLTVVNLSYPYSSRERFQRGPIEYITGDFTDSGFQNECFDAITCLSVIEHGVDTKAFIKESSRLLKEDGYFVLSTDYWPDPDIPANTNVIPESQYNWKLYDREGIREIISIARKHDLNMTTESIDLSAGEQVISPTGDKPDQPYTFVILAFKKTKTG